MSATIDSTVINTDDLFPSILQSHEKEKLTPWVFKHAESADLFCIDRWPEEESKEFQDIFHLFNSYVSETNLFDASLAVPDPLQAYYPESQPYDPDRIEPGMLEDVVGREETVTLPRKSWEYSTREEFAQLMTLQALVLRGLMESLYQKMGLRGSEPRLYFPVANHRQSYHIGGQKYAARPDGAVTIRTQRRDLPILSFTSWFEDQTWGEYLGETLSIMLGQLACNVKPGLGDQEMFVLGFYKRQIFIARGFFTKDQISRVHSKGCSADETFTIAFTRGYDLSSKEDWDEAVERLVGLLRYFLSGNAQIGGLQAFFDKS
ncbi:hypothetical protein BP00DRAFT_493907 [Aspergillus indologenus CBS 114.80]|uniref:Uncharacterized protein n=1 Tax=Aspergillus indologenus CBS 114.80 TaxID=1450541 RepID=A0A2V5I994_9EURO|nr:hypothetical protein BP00DRAFT_493907 [Aspergillus indologenus CBS 114.80]